MAKTGNLIIEGHIAPAILNAKLVINPANSNQVMASWTKCSLKVTQIKNGKEQTIKQNGKTKKKKVESVKEYNAIWSYTLLVSGGTSKVVTEDKITININTTTVTHDIPAGCTSISFKIKPISTKYTLAKDKNGNQKEQPYWTASSYTSAGTLAISGASVKPSAPTISLDNQGKLKISVSNLETGGKVIQFRYSIDNQTPTASTTSGEFSITTNYASWEPSVAKGHTYKASCRVKITGKQWSQWSDWSSETDAIPITPTSLTAKAASLTEIDLEWNAVAGATGYEINYVTRLDDFKLTDGTTVTVNGRTKTRIAFEKSGTYYFRVRAITSNYQSDWYPTSIDATHTVHVTLGLPPAPPTTYALTSVIEYGDTVRLYWIHNAQDGSSQRTAQVVFRFKNYSGSIVEGVVSVPNPNYNEDLHRDDNVYYDIDTSQPLTISGWDGSTASGSVTINFANIDSFDWKVRTFGIIDVAGDWSVYRTIELRVKPTLSISTCTDQTSWDSPSVITSIPLYIKMETGPATQKPISYLVIVTANDTYNYEDIFGNTARIVKGQTVYSSYLISDELTDYFTLTPEKMTFENNVEYLLTVIVATDSGLSAEDSLTFTPNLSMRAMQPDASVEVDLDRLIAHIIPVCRDKDFNIDDYIIIIDGEEYIDEDDDAGQLVDDVVLSVYRKNADGSYTEIDTNLPNTGAAVTTDPHPTLGRVTYRIVAMSTATGQMTYADIETEEYEQPGMVINWNEEVNTVMSDFEFEDYADEYSGPAMYSGNMLKLPYNLEVSEQRNPDVELVEYIGRSRPVSYYGTQQGESYTFNTVITKETFENDMTDPNTLSILRTMISGLHDAYIREAQTGLGCWCQMSMSISSKYNDPLITISINARPIDDDQTFFEAKYAMLRAAKKAEALLPDAIPLGYIDSL